MSPPDSRMDAAPPRTLKIFVFADLERRKRKNQIAAANARTAWGRLGQRREMAVKRDVLDFLKRERDGLADELRQLQQGTRRVVYLDGDLKDVTASVIASGETRLMRFEEFIAASESRVT
jgi:hypothetical protein